MVCNGRVEKGVIVTDADLSTREGHRVTVLFPDESPTDPESALETLRSLMRNAKPSGIPDLSSRVDDYLYGNAKSRHGD